MHVFHPGYCLHAGHARQLATTPWGWRAATVTSAAGGRATALYVDGGTVTLWHHRDLGLTVGEPVRVHEEHHGLEIVDAWLNVRIDAGVGPVPEPEQPHLWAAEVPGVVINQATGDGIRISPDVAARLRRRQKP